jgi:hypothetical protein
MAAELDHYTPGMNPDDRKGVRRLSSDTSPDVEKLLIEGYRQMPAWQKLQQVRELTQMVQKLALAGIRRRYPEATERECRLRLASLWIDANLMKKAFGWDPEKEGY